VTPALFRYKPQPAIYHVDLNVDFYAFSFYKVFGPHYALLYGKRGLLEEIPGFNHFFLQSVIPYKFQPGNVNFELTYGMLGLKFTLARIIFSLVAAIGLGIFFNHLEKKKVKGFVLEAHDPDNCDCQSCLSCDGKKPTFFKSLLKITKELGKYFILGIFIAALLTVLVPQETIPKYIGSSGIFAYAAAVIVGMPLYVCEGEEIPITLALRKLGLGLGPAFTFLLGSVGTCIPTMIMAQKIIGKKPTLFYILSWIVFALTSGLLFSIL